MDDGYFTVMIGVEINGNEKRFLISPQECHIDINDEVEAEDGIAYDVVFSRSYVRTDDSLCAALITALGMPRRVRLHKILREVKWGDEANETDANTACGSDCGSGECRNGDGSVIHG